MVGQYKNEYEILGLKHNNSQEKISNKIEGECMIEDINER
jgi:hypothetical protein